ncbi:hypothetical protein RHMOL_Rhmol02G0013700 [Rhododendron molle]|uniref:Uncharacterized protein n=1 Tax=Rhododendron molle TaxID=49168 RepID=A0ACC0PLT7_RHOML|nr:hypothetical protein RHMOL_Rhmol02G0013700 [Rhododendron molle]
MHRIDVGKAPPCPRHDYFRVADVVLRLLLFAAALVAVVVMVASKETRPVAVIPIPPFVVFGTAKFEDSPAFIYFVAALSGAGLYAIISTVVPFLALLKPRCSTKLLPYFVIFDVVISLSLSLSLSLTFVAGHCRVGNRSCLGSRFHWNERELSHGLGPKCTCNVFGEFYAHAQASVAVSHFDSIVLAKLVILSAHSLSRKIPKY